MSRCLCGKPKPIRAKKCVVYRAGTLNSRPGVRQMTPAMKEALRRVLAKRAA